MKNDDAKCVERILAGDADAFTALVKKYEKQVHAFVWRRVKDYHVAEEITQDTFLRAHEKLGTLRDPNRFSGWLYMIATRCSLTWFEEKRMPMQSLEAMSEAEIEALFYAQYMVGQAEKLATERQRGIVQYLLQKLPAYERTAVVLHYLSEMTCEEIGDFLGVSSGTIKSRLHRARKRLKKEETVVRETLGGMQPSDDLMEDIMNWSQTNEPGGRYVVNRLSVTSDKTLYAVIGDRSIYKLPAGEEVWQLVNADFPRQDSRDNGPIVAHNGTLYMVSSHELFASTDGGATWHSIGACPKGSIRELMVAEETFYLCLDKGIFRSEDAGNSWTDISHGLDSRSIEQSGIGTLRMGHDTLFSGTSFGVYRLKAGFWEHLPLPVDNIVSVNAFVMSGDHIYVAVSVNILAGDGTPEENFKRLWESEARSWWVFRSSDGGDSWTDITPADTSLLIGVLPSITLLAAGETVLLIGKDDGVVARSIDCGNTWTSIESSGITQMQFSIGSTVALDERTFYTGGSTGVHRSTDGGQTWHRFNTRFESRVDGLISFKVNPAAHKSAALYARVGPNLVRSTDAGRSWDAVNLGLDVNRLLSKETPCIVQVVEADGVLYAKGIRRDSTAIFRLSADGTVLNPISEASPSLNSRRLMCYVLGGRSFDFKDDRQMGQGVIITFSSVPDSLSSQLIQENPDFGAERFLEQLIQIQADSALAFKLMWEGLWGNFAVSGETFYMEYNYKLFRWNVGESEWFYTGVEEIIELSDDNVGCGFKLAVSSETVYVGKRDGHLLQSLDSGESWHDRTSNLPLSVAHFNHIVFADGTVHVATDKGVFSSKDGVDWRVLTDETGESVIIKSLATAGDSVYGANDDGIYRLQSDTDTWAQVAPEISGVVTSLVVDEDMFYVGTERQGVLCFNRSV